MKSSTTLLLKSVRVLPILFAAVVATPSMAAEKPAVSIRQAVEIAEGILTQKGVQNEVFIEAIDLQSSTILGAKKVWVVSWSDPIPGREEGKKYFGMEINMKGEVVHLLTGRGKNKKHTSPH